MMQKVEVVSDRLMHHVWNFFPSTADHVSSKHLLTPSLYIFFLCGIVVVVQPGVNYTIFDTKIYRLDPVVRKAGHVLVCCGSLHHNVSHTQVYVIIRNPAQALMNAPSTDFMALMYIVPPSVHRSEPVSSLKRGADSLETAQFVDFWQVCNVCMYAYFMLRWWW